MDLALRLEHEAHFHQDSWFVTLTYDEENVPPGDGLVADHMSGFIKSYRDQNKKQKIRFFGVGEYGGSLGRPHYHMILFGPELQDREKIYTKPSKQFYSSEFIQMFGNPTGYQYYKSETLEKAWKQGIVEATSVSEATMQYVAKFHIEKVTGEKAEEHYTSITADGQLITVEPETARMSRNPGLGREWIEKYWEDVYPKGYLTTKGGIKHAPPKYYDRWLEQHHPEIYADLKDRREKEQPIRLQLESQQKIIDKIRNAQMANGQYYGQ